MQKMFLPSFITLLALLFLNDGQAQRDSSSSCATPTYTQIYDAILSKEFYELSAYFRLLGGQLTRHVDTLERIIKSPQKYPRVRADEFSFCKRKDYYYMVYLRQSTGEGLKLSVTVVTNDLKILDQMKSSIKKYESRTNENDYSIFCGDSFSDPCFNIYFEKFEDLQVSINFHYYRGW